MSLITWVGGGDAAECLEGENCKSGLFVSSPDNEYKQHKLRGSSLALSVRDRLIIFIVNSDTGCM